MNVGSPPAIGRRQVFLYDGAVEVFIGNRLLVDGLFRALRGNRHPHAFLFSGPSRVGKRTLVRFAAQTILGGSVDAGVPRSGFSHPDYLVVRPEVRGESRGAITIAQARSLRRFLSATPFVGDRKVVIIEDADCLTHEAANALLKSLEEPPEDTLIFLVAHHIAGVLPTIRSRTVPVRFSLVSDHELKEGLRLRGFVLAEIDDALSFADGRPGVALKILSGEASLSLLRQRRKEFFQLLTASPFERLLYIARNAREGPAALRESPQAWISVLRGVLLAQPFSRGQRAGSSLRRLFEADSVLQKTNANPALVLERALLY